MSLARAETTEMLVTAAAEYGMTAFTRPSAARPIRMGEMPRSRVRRPSPGSAGLREKQKRDRTATSTPPC